jgi:NADPH:quinone reductase-like Zn-dependent oxidoreductase
MTRSASMRAWRIHEYGDSKKMVLEEGTAPSLQPGSVLIKVAALSVCPVDWKVREGHHQRMYQLKFPATLGRDCAGVVEESAASQFQAGERVLAVTDQTKGYPGAHAPYALVPAEQVAKIPPAVSDAQALAFGVSGTSAWVPLVEVAKVSAGMRVLVHGGAGGVGSVAVQLARHLGAEVFATCGPNNLDYVKSLGAARAIDYTREDFVQIASPCDVVFDTVGGETHRRSFAALKAGGLLVRINSAPIDPKPARDDVRSELAMVRTTGERMAKQLELAAKGVLKAQIGQQFTYAQLPAAYDASKTGHARGKIVVTCP